MGLRSKISWTHATWNPWFGCTEVSPACDHCYARVLMQDRFGKVEWGAGQPRVRTSVATWNDMARLQRQAVKEGSRKLCFTASLADIFDAEVPLLWLADALDTLLSCPHVDVLLLTKRPHLIRERIAKALPDRGNPDAVNKHPALAAYGWLWIEKGVPFPNIRFGTTVESQKFVHRLKSLCDLPAHVLFVSAEPLLGPLQLARALETRDGYYNFLAGEYVHTDRETLKPIRTTSLANRITQVIVGGESGDDAGAKPVEIRPMHPNWARSLREQCRENNTAFFFKQWGEWIPTEMMKELGVTLDDIAEEWRFEDDLALSRVKFRVRHKIEDTLDGRRFYQVPGYTEKETPAGPELRSVGLAPHTNYLTTPPEGVRPFC